MITNDNLPLGAKEDPLAPFNEPLNIPYKRYCSLTISFDYTLNASPNLEEEQLKELFINEVISKGFNIPKDYCIDDFEIIEE